MMKNVNIRFLTGLFLLDTQFVLVEILWKMLGIVSLKWSRHPDFHNFRLCKNFCSKYKDLELLQKHI